MVARQSVNPDGNLAMECFQMNQRFTEEEIIRMLREAEKTGVQIRELCHRHNVTERTFYRWRNKYGGMDVPNARRLKAVDSAGGSIRASAAAEGPGTGCKTNGKRPAAPVLWLSTHGCMARRKPVPGAPAVG
jgi:putative transposase